jgi:acetolactate synthase-1/2/3 large subunit
MMPIEEPPWRESVGQARTDYEAWQQRPAVYAHAEPRLDLWEVVRILARAVPEDAIITNGAGNFSVWAHRFYEFSRYPTQLAPTSGAMGYGVPAAITAKLLHPDRIAVAMAGDGDFLMTGQELATAAQHDAAIVVLVVNNGMYGTIRMHQERRYPGRVSGTDLVNPDFAALARSFGAHGAVVERTEQFPAAFDEALDSGRPALIELRVDREALTPWRSLSEIRQQALAGAPGAEQGVPS